MTDDNETIVAGLAVIATSTAEMGGSADEVKAAVAHMMMRLRIEPGEYVAVLRAAAAAVSRLPQAPEESAEETERSRAIRELLGVTSADDQLSAALVGRECLEEMADHFDSL